MNRPGIALLVLLLAAACSSAPEVRTDSDPAIEARERELRDKGASRTEFERVLLQLDLALDSYVKAMANKGEPRANRQIARLEKAIHDLVRDEGARWANQPPGEPGVTYKRLLATAADSSVPANQGIALAALGFAGLSEAMPVLLQGAQLQNPDLVDRAVLGLAVLREPKTPPGVLFAIVENENHPEDGRAQAAWTLYRLQEFSEKQSEIVAGWERLLRTKRETLPAAVIVQAVRGLGLSRAPGHAELVASYAPHLVPRVRMAVAIALARMNAQDQVEALLKMLLPSETNANVRFHAKQALEQLAGGVDRGYDVDAWRKVFDRGNKR